MRTQPNLGKNNDTGKLEPEPKQREIATPTTMGTQRKLYLSQRKEE